MIFITHRTLPSSDMTSQVAPFLGQNGVNESR